MKLPVKLTDPLPKRFGPGYFGAVRRYDVHTGIDLYCEDGAEVIAMEDGVVISIEKFTGEHADSPWWNNTWAILIEGQSGVICYGELIPLTGVEEGSIIESGSIIGHVRQVLKKDKGVTPTSMLHLELYKPGTKKTVWWKLGEKKPEELLDPTTLLDKNEH